MLLKQPIRRLCELCKISFVKSNGISKHGFKKWHKYCSTCAKIKYCKNISLTPKKLKCDKCNFKAEDRCQLGTIYLDDNKLNLEKTNIRTYCYNCIKLYQKNKKNKSFLDITVDTDVLI